MGYFDPSFFLFSQNVATRINYEKVRDTHS